MCMGTEPAYQQESELRRLYCSEKHTIREIADRFDISTATVHYWMEKHGIDRRYTGTLRERFEQYHEKNANEQACWLLQNKPDDWGYGTIYDADKPGHRKAHRVAFDLFRDEELPDFSPDAQINHKCDNAACVNPDHLYIGTAADNTQDALEADAWEENRLRGSAIGNSKLSEEQVREIKRRCNNGESQKSVSEDYPVSHSTVNQIMTGNRWTHVG